MRRTLLSSVVRLAALCALALGLSSCGIGDLLDGPDPTASPTAQETEEAATADPATEDDPEETSPGTTAPDQEPTTAEDPDGATPEPEDVSEPVTGSTEIEETWIDRSWFLEAVDEDLCAGGALTASPYAQREDLFVCGPGAVNALACSLVEQTEVWCIVDVSEKRAISFLSPSALEADAVVPREGEPLPLWVTLPDGARCSVVARDHDQHWDGMLSWYRCDDGSELLASGEISGTFERGKPWTVQRSVDQQAPEAVAVRTAVFAGP